MDAEVTSIITRFEHLLATNDAETAWNLQEQFVTTYNRQPPNSEGRIALANIWKRMMLKWH